MNLREGARFAALLLLVTAGFTVFAAWLIVCGWLVYHLMKWLPT